MSTGSAFEAPSGFVLSKVASPSASAAELPVQPARRSFLYADQALSQTGVKLQKMKDELGQAKADEDQLNAENVALKGALEKWRAAGERVANREARAVELLQHSNSEPEAPAATATATTASDLSLLSRAAGSMQGLTSLATHEVPSSRGVWAALASVAVCGMLVALWSTFELGGKLSKARVAWNGATSRLSCGRMTPMLRSMGAAHYRIEISEIHVGSLLGGGDVQVSVAVGEGATDPQCTEVVRRCDGSFLKFGETFVMDVRKGGQPLVLQVIDSRGKLASLRLPAREAITLALREHSHYYRSELVAEPALLQQLSQEASDRKPYAAMKIRDLTSQIGGTEGTGARQMHEMPL